MRVKMPACKAASIELGTHYIPYHRRWSGDDLIVPPSPMFAALDAAYDAMLRSRVRRALAEKAA